MTPLAEYFHKRYLNHHAGTIVHEPYQIEFVKVPKATVTHIKAFVLAGIVVASFVPPQYAWVVILVTNGYWMFKL